MSKSLWLQEECKCGARLYAYTTTLKLFHIDCSECNEFKEIEFKSLKELKKLYKLKT